jgi:prepilin peptidase CpaA
MDLVAEAPQWAFWGLIVLLFLAALQDSVMLKISNYLCGAVLLLGIVTAVIAGPEAALWENGVVFLAALVIGTFLFGRGILGGGDVKLFAATILWFELGGALRFLIYTAIAGGVLAILIILARFVPWPEALRSRVRVLQPKAGIPYGIAIAAGAMLTAASLQGSQAANPAANPVQNWTVPSAR